jgi:hypothetical protein
MAVAKAGWMRALHAAQLVGNDSDLAGPGWGSHASHAADGHHFSGSGGVGFEPALAYPLGSVRRQECGDGVGDCGGGWRSANSAGVTGAGPASKLSRPLYLFARQTLVPRLKANPGAGPSPSRL